MFPFDAFTSTIYPDTVSLLNHTNTANESESLCIWKAVAQNKGSPHHFSNRILVERYVLHHQQK